MPQITTTTLPAGIVGGAYSQPIVAVKSNLSLEVSRAGPGVLADGSGVDNQGKVDWDAVIVLTYTIENTGDDDLAIAAVTPSVVTPADSIGITAVLSGSPGTPVEPGATATFEITITLSAAIDFDVLVSIDSDADAPQDTYTFNITGSAVDALFGPPPMESVVLGPPAMDFTDGSVGVVGDGNEILFVEGSVAEAADLAELVAASEWAVDLGRGTTAVYQTIDTTTPAVADGDPIYSIYPEKTPTGSTAIKLTDSNTTNHGTYKDAAGYNIGGLPVILLDNSTQGQYNPHDSSDVDQTDNSNYISTNQWWVAWLMRVRSGTDTNWHAGPASDGVPRLYVEYNEDSGSGNQGFRLAVDATGGAINIGNVSIVGEVFFGAAFWDGTDLHWWSNSTVRTDQTPGSSLNLNALNSTTPVIIGVNNSATELCVQAWYQGDQLTNGSISEHIAALQELVTDFASR